MRTFLLMFVGLALAAAGCSVPVGPEAPPPPEVTLSKQHEQIAEADNRFGLRLFRQLDEDATTPNLFVSPLSLSMALGMTLNGAAGETRADIEQALGVEGLAADEINAVYRDFLDWLPALDRRVTFDIANSIWVDEGFPVEPAFLDVNRRFFDAEVAALDFRTPDAPRRINDWVSDETRGRIDRLIDGPIPEHVVMYLVNALYFLGDWRYRFDERATAPAPFTRADGSTVEVPMMRRDEVTLPFAAGDGFDALELPYGDSLFAMTLLVPHEAHALDALVARLTPELWAQTTAALTPRRFSGLELPKFRIESDFQLKPTLMALGMERPFLPGGADFSGINAARGRDLYITHIRQKTFVEVDEAGTEAAAATVVGIGIVSLPVRFQVNRPFVFVIRERTTGAILFIGKMADPSAAS